MMLSGRAVARGPEVERLGPQVVRAAVRGAMFNLPVVGTDGAVRWILHRFEPTPASAERDPAEMAMALEAAEARLRSILENAMLDVMYDIPSQDRVKEVVVNDEVISAGTQPIIVYDCAESA